MTGPPKTTRTLSVKERILVYLHNYGDISDVDPVAHMLTQESIMGATMAPRGSVSRALKGLMEQDLIKAELAHVKGAKRRQKAYSLTFHGFPKADDLVNEMLACRVSLKELDGEIRDSSVEEGLEKAEALVSDVDLLQVLSLTELTGVIDLPNFRIISTVDTGGIDEEVARETGLPLEIVKADLPLTEGFVGRTKELERIGACLGTGCVVVIYGMPGIGKSSLAAQYLSTAGKKTAWVRVLEYHSLRGLLDELANALASQGKGELLKYLGGVDEPDIGSVLSVLTGYDDVILGFDDLHCADERIVRFLGYLKDKLAETGSGLKVITVSRKLLPFYDPRDVRLKGVVTELELGGLDRAGSGELLGSVLQEEAGEDVIDRVFKSTGGHPMAIELTRSVQDIGEHPDLETFLRRELLSDLSEAEADLVELVSVFRNPAPREAFQVKSDIRGDLVDMLMQKSVLEYRGQNTCMLAGPLQDVVYNGLSKDERIKYHALAAEYYQAVLPVDGVREAVYHLDRAQKLSRAGDYLASVGPGLIADGFSEFVWELLGSYDFTGVENETLRKLEDLREGILRTWGDWDNVLEHYYQAYLLAVSLDPDGGITPYQVRMHAGPLGWSKEELSAGISNQDRSLDVLEGPGDRGEVLRSKGWNHWMLGELDEALQAYTESLKLMAGDKEASCRVILGLGAVYREREDLKGANRELSRGLGLAQELGDLRAQARFENGLGILELDSGSPAKARMHFALGLDLARRVNFLKGEAYILLHLGQCLVKGGDEEGPQLLERSGEMFLRMGDPLGAAYALAGRAMTGEEPGLFGKAKRILGDKGTEHYRTLLGMR